MRWSVNQIPDQSGGVAIVTGANVGLGYENALLLARSGAEVVMACRNAQKAALAKAGILAEHPGVSNTPLVRHMPRLVRTLASLLPSARSGSLSAIYAARGDDIKSGDFAGPNGPGEIWGRPVKTDSDAQSKDTRNDRHPLSR